MHAIDTAGMQTSMSMAKCVRAGVVRCATVLLLALASMAGARADPRFAEVDARLQALVQTHSLPGAVLLISQDGEPVYARALGAYALEQRLPLASATKWVAATVLARLVDQGRLRWDDRIDRYAGDLPADKQGLTVRQLFALTSGLPGGDLSGAAPCLSNRATTLEACARQILALPLQAPPGTSFDYGGNSMQVAGWIAEKATGEDWNRLFRDELATPLGLTSIDFGLLPGVNVGNPRIGGGAYATAGDYMKLLQLHLDAGRFEGPRLLDPGTVAEMQRRQTRGTVTVSTPFSSAAGYGIGHWVDREAPDGHTAQLSSPGAFGFTPWIDTRRRIAGVLAVQGSYAAMALETRALMAAVAQALDKDTATVPFADFGGLWWDPGQAGSGITLVQQANGALLASWYTFDDTGAPMWVFAAGGWLGSDRWRGTIFRAGYAGTGALTQGIDPGQVATSAIGSLDLAFSSGSRGSWSFRIGAVERSFAIERFPPLP